VTLGVGFVVGLLAGILLYRTYVRNAPGKPVQPYEQAVIKRGGTMVCIDGPAWLRVIDTINMVGIYDVSDKRLPVHVEPAHAPLARPDPGGPTRQRFFIDIVVVYRPVAMDRVLGLGEQLEEWISHHVRTAVRQHALTLVWNEFSDGQEFAEAARRRLELHQSERGVRMIEVFAERIATRPAGEMEHIAKGSNARHLGREGLQLAYLETLKDLAAQPSTKILLPSDMPVDADTVLRRDL
jgi:hypothetical protein